ncbi:MAG: GNAT family N-acetyltransferase [Selenomonadaceae bacterium]|nr:GNAT family N-acetyltransferase [Selenomonadaceae bacterium]
MIELVPTRDDERENFIKNIQVAFKKAVVEEFGDNGEEVIPREDVEKSFNETGAQILNIVSDGKIVGGAVVVIRPDNQNELLLFYVNVDTHGKGIGSAAWRAIEARYPDTKIWETVTPYFEKRNLHFYINKCGFHAVEFFNPKHKAPDFDGEDFPGGDYFFRFEKVMKS